MFINTKKQGGSASSIDHIIILIDYRGAFNSKASNARTFGSLDVERLRDEFASQGFDVEIRPFPSLEFRGEDFKNRWILLTSSEDRNAFYKSYIEDVALALRMCGAKLIPSFEQLRAHHNKAFGELMRGILGWPELTTVDSRVFGTYEDFAREPQSYPQVFKIADGFGSRGVRLAVNPRSGKRIAKRLSRSFQIIEVIKELTKRAIRPRYVPRSLHRRKFICQTYVDCPAGDYKVLVYGQRYYCLGRSNRPRDFRASGSGRFSFPKQVPHEVLSFASSIFTKFESPCASLDIACDGEQCYLFEFQFLSFGTYTIERAPHYFCWGSSGWELVNETSCVEAVFAESVAGFIRAKAAAGS